MNGIDFIFHTIARAGDIERAVAELFRGNVS